MSSIKIEEIDDKERRDLVQVTNIPSGQKVKQVQFTNRRMFVLTELGNCYVYKIDEI